MAATVEQVRFLGASGHRMWITPGLRDQMADLAEDCLEDIAANLPAGGHGTRRARIDLFDGWPVTETPTPIGPGHPDHQDPDRALRATIERTRTIRDRHRHGGHEDLSVLDACHMTVVELRRLHTTALRLVEEKLAGTRLRPAASADKIGV